jgi:LPS export ABC transporter protein LptC
MRVFRLLTLALAIMFLATACGIKFKNGTSRSREFADFILGDFKYISANNSGQREFEIKASEALMYNTRNEVFLYNMAMSFYNSKNQLKSFVSANSGYINKMTMNVFAEGKVKILGENHAVLEANKVYWDNTRKLFYTDPEELVTIRHGNTVITGYKLLADNTLREVKLETVSGDIRGK